MHVLKAYYSKSHLTFVACKINSLCKSTFHTSAVLSMWASPLVLTEFFFYFTLSRSLQALVGVNKEVLRR